MRAWMLQPRNYSQDIPRNYYNLAYRNTGVYKGLGQTLDCPGQPGCPGYTPGVPTPQGGDATLAQIQAEIDALFGYTGAGQPPASPSFMQQYGVYLALGLAALALLVGGRR